jgi:tetratricopeptide (TPR) repeat protein
VLGNSLGISIRSFINTVNELEINSSWLQIVRTPALDNTQLASIDLIQKNISEPTNPSVDQWIEYGNQLSRLGRSADSVKAFDRAITLTPNLLDAYYGKGLALRSQGNWVATLTAFDQAIALIPSENQSSYYYLWKHRSAALKHLQRYTEALVAISYAIKLEPQDTSLLNEKSILLVNVGRHLEAIKIYDFILEKEGSKVWIYYNRGLSKYALGDKKGAIDDIEISAQLFKAQNNQQGYNRAINLIKQKFRQTKMVRSTVKVMTLAEFLLLPETKPANEFIDSQITQKTMPPERHGLIQGQLVIDEETDVLLVPEFAKDFHLTLGDLFGWLRD